MSSGGPPKLEVVAGPHKGNEFVLENDEVVVGRASDNAVAIPDTSVSRKHVLLRKTETGWAASDMGSGNGTLVNGAAIAEETALNNGDVITLGDTELKYVDDAAGAGAGARAIARRSGESPSGARARPMVRRNRGEDPDASAKKKKNLIRFGAIAVVLLAGGIGFKALSAKKDDELKKEQLRKNAGEAEIRAAMQEAKNLVRSGKWVEAKAKFLEVQEADANGTQATSLKDYLAKCEQEIPNQQHLDEADGAVKAGEITKAYKLLEQVTKDTSQITRKDEIRQALDRKIDARMQEEAAPLLAETKDKAKMQQLLAIATDVLGARPEHRDALAAKKTADDAIYAIDNPYKPPPVEAKPWLDVAARYQSGDQSGALALADACAAKPQCKQLAGQIRDFADKYKRLESANANELVAMLELDRKISGGQPSPMAKNVNVRVVGEYYKKASAAKAKNEWGAAITAAKYVLLADPGHAGAQNILTEGKGKAKDIYLQGYQAKDGDPDQARTLFKQVLQMTTKDDEYYAKAQSQLEKLK